MIPLPRDEILNVEPTNVITNISSNVYYGYQPRIHTHVKDSQININQEQRISDDDQMEIHFHNFHENNMQIENDITRYVNRKRRLQETTNDNTEEFKKRRQIDYQCFKGIIIFLFIVHTANLYATLFFFILLFK